MATTTTTREVPAKGRGPWMVCGGCDTRIGRDIVPICEGARIKCFRCRAWVVLSFPR